MDDKIFDFAKTKDALSQLSADLIELSSAVKIKQTKLTANQQQAEKTIQNLELKIAELDKSLQSAIAEIDLINNYIEEAL